jgi:UDP-N-acetyl-D-mannosaminuronate dehydrogenase
MPKFVAERAISIISKKVKNPKILILGVAYKPGTGDTRNTPTSELRKHLEANGAIVAWNDPFVKVWEGTVPVDLEWPYDLAILTIKQPNLNLDKLFLTEKYILDCTNTLSGSPRVVSL